MDQSKENINMVNNIQENLESSQKAVRNSSLELLRIISMLGIVLIHYFRHGMNPNDDIITTNRIIYELFSFIGRFGVICFVMITGYFMVNSKIKIRSLVKLVLEVIFFSMAITIISMAICIEPFSIKTLIKSCFPIMFRQYWFISVYVALYILIPFINILVYNLNKRQHLILISILICIFSIIPMFTGQRWETTTDFYQNLGLFITIYFIAAYVKLYPNKYFNNIKLNIIITVVMQIVVWSLIIIIMQFGNKIGIKDTQYFNDFNSPIVLIQSISIFLIFKNIDIKSSKFINSIGKSTLAVYLIHEHPIIYPIIWKDIFKSEVYYNSSTMLFLLNILLSVGIVFIVSIVIDKIRIVLIEKKIFKIYDNKIRKYRFKKV